MWCVVRRWVFSVFLCAKRSGVRGNMSLLCVQKTSEHTTVWDCLCLFLCFCVQIGLFVRVKMSLLCVNGSLLCVQKTSVCAYSCLPR